MAIMTVMGSASLTAFWNKIRQTFQPKDADLTAIASLTGTSGLLKKTAADTWTLDTTSYASSSSLNTHTENSTVHITAAERDAWNAKLGTTGNISGALTFAGNDSYGIFTATNNYCSIGSSSKKFYRAYISNIYGTTIYENGTSLSQIYAAKSHSHAYSDLTGTPTIPTKTSQLTNDSGFIKSNGSITGNAATANALIVSSLGITMTGDDILSALNTSSGSSSQSDSGWQSLSVNTSIKYRKIGSQVFFKGSVSVTGPGSSSNKTLGTISSGYRPASQVTWVQPTNLGGPNLIRIYISTSGTMSFNIESLMSQNGWQSASVTIYFDSFSYFID